MDVKVFFWPYSVVPGVSSRIYAVLLIPPRCSPSGLMAGRPESSGNRMFRSCEICPELSLLSTLIVTDSNPVHPTIITLAPVKNKSMPKAS